MLSLAEVAPPAWMAVALDTRFEPRRCAWIGWQGRAGLDRWHDIVVQQTVEVTLGARIESAGKDHNQIQFGDDVNLLSPQPHGGVIALRRIKPPQVSIGSILLFPYRAFLVERVTQSEDTICLSAHLPWFKYR